MLLDRVNDMSGVILLMKKNHLHEIRSASLNSINEVSIIYRYRYHISFEKSELSNWQEKYTVLPRYVIFVGKFNFFSRKIGHGLIIPFQPLQHSWQEHMNH